MESSGVPQGLERPELLKWVGEPVNLREYFDEFRSVLPEALKTGQNPHPSKISTRMLSSLMGVALTEDEANVLDKYCSDDKLDVEGEPPSMNIAAMTKKRSLNECSKIPPPETCELTTLAELRRREKDKVFLKYASGAYALGQQDEARKKRSSPNQDILIFVKIYEPFHCAEQHMCKAKPFTEEFSVLGTQTLDVLKDCITCPNNFAGGDISEDPLKKPGKPAKDLFKSGSFFINNTFYNDFRCSANIDYSLEIRKWAEEKGLGTTAHASMSTTRFEALTVRFGYPYVYLHQGNCEHILVFSDARLLCDYDTDYRKNYPMRIGVGITKKQMCMLCNTYIAQYITIGNERATVDPMYFCTQCFLSFNYVDGKKIGQFKAYKLQI